MMQLTDDERHMVYRLQQKQAAWNVVKWFLLALGVCEAYKTVSMFQLSSPTEEGRLTIHLARLVYMVFTFTFIALPLSYWHGNPTTTLLLKLADHLMQDNPKN